jgi:hypothetical protein
MIKKLSNQPYAPKVEQAPNGSQRGRKKMYYERATGTVCIMRKHKHISRKWNSKGGCTTQSLGTSMICSVCRWIALNGNGGI